MAWLSRAVGLIAAWAAPLLVLAAVAWYRPGWVVITGILCLLAAAVSRHAARPEAGRRTPHGPPKVA